MSQQDGAVAGGDRVPARPLRVAALAKQVPATEELALGTDGRLRRGGVAHEMNAFCRRAVAEGTELARATGGTCTVLTLGPPPAEDVLREAVAWGADRGVHLCDPAFAGSDTLATARALAAALAVEGPFDLVLVGRSSLDGETGQVGPALAELTGLPFAGAVRELSLDGGVLDLRLEQDDGWQEVRLALPAVLSVAERLCDPCKVPPDRRAEVPAAQLRRLSAADLGPGPWGQDGSPTRVGAVRAVDHHRARRVLAGDVAGQVAEAVAELRRRGALDPGPGARAAEGDAAGLPGPPPGPPGPLPPPGAGSGPYVAVVLEPGRAAIGAELLGAAARLAREIGGRVAALAPAGALEAPDAGHQGPATGRPAPHHPTHPAGLAGSLGADVLVDLVGPAAADDVAAAVQAWAGEHRPWALLSPSTSFGREVAARVAAALGAGLVGDAVGLEVAGGRLVAAKPAFAGALVADVTCTSPLQMATVRPGVLPVPPARHHVARRASRPVPRRGRVEVRATGRDDDVEVLARADAVIGVGTGVAPDEYERLGTLAALLGAELAATRKVTDRGWAPRARQVGITGRSISPRLYVALGLSGKLNHMAGVRSAGTVLALNVDPAAPVFHHADVGIVADWHDALPHLEAELRRLAAGGRPATRPVPGPARRLATGTGRPC